MADTPSYSYSSEPRERVYFDAGNKVRLKQFPEPTMVVKQVLKIKDVESGKGTLLGISCMWFTRDGAYQEQTFSTKDLVKVEGAE